jgi:hypothetical protein
MMNRPSSVRHVHGVREAIASKEQDVVFCNDNGPPRRLNDLGPIAGFLHNFPSSFLPSVVRNKQVWIFLRAPKARLAL